MTLLPVNVSPGSKISQPTFTSAQVSHSITTGSLKSQPTFSPTGYTYVHPFLTKETLASNLKGKRQNGCHAKTLNKTLRTYSAHITCTP